MIINYAVVGDTRRIDLAISLTYSLEASLALDKNGQWGPGVNHRRAWTIANSEDADWIVVLEDDAELCKDFLKHAERALSEAPTDVVSFYLGTNYPIPHAQVAERRVLEAESLGQRWIEMSTLNHAVAVAVRQSHVRDMLHFVATQDLPIDEAITQWAKVRRIRVSYPIVSLVDHMDHFSVIDQKDRSDSVERRLPRRALRFLGPRD